MDAVAALFLGSASLVTLAWRASRRQFAAQEADEDRLDREAVDAFSSALEQHFKQPGGGGGLGAGVTPAQLARLGGRATKGTAGSDQFTWLNSDGAIQRTAFAMAGDGLAVFLNEPRLIDAMRTLGWEDRWIRRKLEDGKVFKLGVFPLRGSATPATWDGVIEMIGMAFPESVADKVRRHAAALRSTAFETIEAEARKPGGFLGPDSTYFDVNETKTSPGKSDDPRFMSEARFAEAGVAGTLYEARGFLYQCLSLNPLFDGNGYTKTESGERGIKEYLVVNQRVAEMRLHRYIDMPVTLADLN